MSDKQRNGFGSGFLQDAQGLAVLRGTGAITREEVRENLRRAYGLHLPEPEFTPDFPPAAEPVLAGPAFLDEMSDEAREKVLAEWRAAYEQATGEEIDFDPDDFEEEDSGAGS